MKLIVDLIYEGGLSHMRYSISNTAEFGDYTVGPKVITADTRQRMQEVLERIKSGDFANAWLSENKDGGATFKRLRAEEAQHPMEEVGRELRKRMSFARPQ